MGCGLIDLPVSRKGPHPAKFSPRPIVAVPIFEGALTSITDPVIVCSRMIRSFACRETERLFEDESSRRFPPSIQRVARRKLLMLDQARQLNDLRSPPGNRLEAPKGDRAGQHSIRSNDQWRICFKWQANEAYEVEIVDYH